MVGLFDSETFSLIDKPLPADKIISTKLTFKIKLKSNGDFDKLKTRICMSGDMQIKSGNNNSWSPTASTRLKKYLAILQVWLVDNNIKWLK